ncbi:uncharacterized protein BXIN_2178 [Babesia sp. Xinjiang]|uniref:uncharacterized protein n=1 Tax=Babesia sp. Xinjiang TaxID=462227 RepID=UPI000A21BE67|nr:uncharacterized protein BXIN_2178 [Babesia sp. Xinjiang]ORM40425.1 hypothetical protein BXIN_2178 [Babesia sp. Xinjiang]
MRQRDISDTCDELIELTETWSLCNDDIYRIANQLLSLAFAVKYFGNDTLRSRVWRVCVSFYAELEALGEQVEQRPNFNYDCVYLLLHRTLDTSSKTDENEDVLVEEDKSTMFSICPISRRPITYPVSQRFSHGEDSCEHVFDNSSITELLRSSNSSSVDCPVAACTKKVYKSRLHRDWESVHWRRHQDYVKTVESAKALFNKGALYL